MKKANKSEALNYFDLDQDRKTIFIFGGSQGSHAINKAMKESLTFLRKEKNLQLLWQTGVKDLDWVKKSTQTQELKCVVLPFIQDMGKAYSASDLVISRAGALSLAELTLCGKPSILVPYPFAAADHQRFNANVLEEAGASQIILEKDLDGGKLADLILGLMKDENRLKEMGEESQKLSFPKAVADIVDEMEELLERKEKSK